MFRGLSNCFVVFLTGILIQAGYADLPAGDYTIVTFGDSTTAPRTVGGFPLYIYTDILRDELPAAGITGDVFNHGQGGRHSGSVTDNNRFNIEHALDHYPDVLARSPDIVIMQFGINDSWIDYGIAYVSEDKVYGDLSRIPYAPSDPRNPDYPHNYYDNLTFLVQTFKAAGIRVILMTPNYITSDQWRRDVLGVYVQKARDVAAAENIELADIWQMYHDYAAQPDHDYDDLLLDGVHPNAVGHRMAADAIYTILDVSIPELPELYERKTYSSFDYVYEFEPPHDNLPELLDKYPVISVSDFDINRLDAGGHNTAVGTANVADGILTIDTGATTMNNSASGGRWYTAYDPGQVWAESDISFADGYTIELRARVIPAEQLGSKSFSIIAGPDADAGRGVLDVAEAATLWSGLLIDANSNADVFHTFRFVQYPDLNAFCVYREDNMGLIHRIYKGYRSLGAGPYFFFGDGSSSYGGKVLIDYLAFTPGAYAPISCSYILPADLNKDCYINLLDLLLFVHDWLKCTDPADTLNCPIE